MTRKQKKTLLRIGLCVGLSVLRFLLPLTGWGTFALGLGIYLLIGYDILFKALHGILHGQWADENFLMAVATLGAIALAVLYEGELTEAIAVMLFYQIGELFQSIALRKSRNSIRALTALISDTAYLAKEDGRVPVSPEDLKPQDVIELHPGERIPADCVISRGFTQVDTSPVTGEGLPREAKEGDALYSGCVILTGAVQAKVTKPADSSLAARILSLVEDAAAKKAKPEQFITRFSRIYTPAVCIAALLLALLPPMGALLTGGAANWSIWLYRALTFLVISCPCALVISIPLGFFGGIGCAGKNGILVKGSCFLESLARGKTVLFDKTGTLTKGSFEVTAILSEDPERLLRITATAQSASSHPIAKSIRKAYGKPLPSQGTRDLIQLPGEGILCTVEGKRLAAGNEKLMAREGVSFSPCTEAGTLVYVALDGAYQGCLVIRDQEKPEAKSALAALKRSGITRTAMLTGDNHSAAIGVGEALGLEQVHAELLPQEKLELVEAELSRLNGGEMLFYVGDGINDAPVLKRAHVGIAMGAMGTEAAMEAADVVILDDDLRRLPQAIAIGKKTLGITGQNIAFSLAVKALCLILGALGLANMALAIFADVGVMVLAVLNALRTMKAPKLN